MVADLPKTKDRPFPEELIPLGSALQTACRAGGDVPRAVASFCELAFTSRELALAGASFLLATFVKDLRRLGDLLGTKYMADEFCAGSSALCSLISAYWDRKGETDRLAALADEILARKLPSDRYDMPLAEFIAALAAALAIPEPERAESLLKLVKAGSFHPGESHFLEEVQEWQRAGQLLANSSAEEKSFWQQEMRKRRRNWFWDTDEGRDAIRKLEAANPSATEGATMIHRVVPRWAWEQAAEESTSQSTPPLQSPPQQASSSCVLEASPKSPGSGGALMPRRNRALQAVAAGATGILLLAAAMTLLDEGPSPAPKAGAEVAPAVQTSVSSLAENDSLEKASSGTNASLMEDPADVAGKTPPLSVELPVQAAQLVPVELTGRSGWLRSPLGLEFQVTAANAKEGKITDPQGKPWKLPLDPALVAQVAGDQKIVNPYTGDIERVPEDLWRAGGKVPWEKTGWSFKLPDPLSSAVADASTTESSIATDASSDSAAITTLAATLDQESPQPAAAEDQPAAEVANAEGQPSTVDFINGNAATLEARLHPDYTRQRPRTSSRQGTKTKPATSPRQIAKTETKAEISSVPASKMAGPQARSSFVTRANNIRMTYKDGYWESSPGSYLNSSVTTPERWARDMTLRERSSGTIPPGYAFAVANDGTVRVVPDGSKP